MSNVEWKIARWDGKGFTSVRFTGEGRHTAALFLYYWLWKCMPDTVKSVRHYSTPGIFTPSVGELPAAHVQVFGKKKRVYSAIMEGLKAYQTAHEGTRGRSDGGYTVNLLAPEVRVVHGDVTREMIERASPEDLLRGSDLSDAVREGIMERAKQAATKLESDLPSIPRYREAVTSGFVAELMKMPDTAIFAMDYSYGDRSRIKTVQAPPLVPHAFVKGTGMIRKFGAPMRNPPSPVDFIPNPFCKICRRYPKDAIHDVISNHDPGDEDRS